ncbi:MAG: hypothetical protein Phog2KO_07170 [Phototrophicaceae bacterium]
MNPIQEQENLVTLGQRLKRVRELRGMSALKVAATMDSSLTSIRDWENGARKLQSDTVRRLAEALELSYPEEMYWLGLAGHIPHTRMPAKHQIMTALEAYYDDICRLPYPAQIIDHHFRYWVVNSATVDFIGNRDGLASLMANKLSIPDIIFNTQIGYFKRVSREDEIRSRQHQLARRMMGRSIHRRHEKFYQELPMMMKGRLSEADYSRFLDIWTDVNAVLDEKDEQPRLADDIMLRYFEFEYPSGDIRRLQLRTDHIRYFGDLFEITVFYPHEAGTGDLYPIEAEEGIKLWDVTPIDNTLREYDW